MVGYPYKQNAGRAQGLFCKGKMKPKGKKKNRGRYTTREARSSFISTGVWVSSSWRSEGTGW